MKKLDKYEIKEILERHMKWVKLLGKGSRKAIFEFIDLRGFCFSRYNLTLVEFINCDLRCVDFSYADLSNVDFTHSDLRGADFGRACLNYAIFSYAIMNHSNNFHESVGADVSGGFLEVLPHGIFPAGEYFGEQIIYEA